MRGMIGDGLGRIIYSRGRRRGGGRANR